MIIDHDTVEMSNLQRQILHNEETVGMYKTESAAKAILRRAFQCNDIENPHTDSSSQEQLQNQG